jgi:hypothetical protein
MKMIWRMLAPYKFVYYDEDSGIILGVVLYNVSDGTGQAYYNNQLIGEYISEEKAKLAVEYRHNNPQMKDE